MKIAPERKNSSLKPNASEKPSLPRNVRRATNRVTSPRRRPSYLDFSLIYYIRYRVFVFSKRFFFDFLRDFSTFRPLSVAFRALFPWFVSFVIRPRTVFARNRLARYAVALRSRSGLRTFSSGFSFFFSIRFFSKSVVCSFIALFTSFKNRGWAVCTPVRSVRLEIAFTTESVIVLYTDDVLFFFLLFDSINIALDCLKYVLYCPW